jgi:hypothetical protein
MYESNRRFARRIVALDRRDYGRANDFLVLERLVDLACHAALESSELVDDHLESPPERQRHFGRVVTQAYIAVDAMLGDLLQEYGPEDNVVVLSDHGFHVLMRKKRPPAYGHTDAPPGMFMARGPAFRPGRYNGLGVMDVFPLLARVQGLPLAADLARPVPEQVLSDAVLARPVRRVPRYDAFKPTGEGAGDQETDEEMMERLRALGYVQ